MPLQSRAAQGFAGAAVKIDLTLKGIKTSARLLFPCKARPVKIDLTLKGIKTTTFVKRFMMKVSS